MKIENENSVRKMFISQKTFFGKNRNHTIWNFNSVMKRLMIVRKQIVDSKFLVLTQGEKRFIFYFHKIIM